MSQGHVFSRSIIGLAIIEYFLLWLLLRQKKWYVSYVGHLLNPCWIILINLRFYICPGDMFIFGNVHLGVCALFLLKLFFFHFGKINSLGVNMLASTRANLDYFIPAHNLRLVPGTWFFWGKARFCIHGIIYCYCFL